MSVNKIEIRNTEPPELQRVIRKIDRNFEDLENRMIVREALKTVKDILVCEVNDDFDIIYDNNGEIMTI